MTFRESLASATKARTYSGGSIHNLVTAGGTACRRIRVESAGTLVLRLVDDTSDVTIGGLVAGEVLDVQATVIRASSSGAWNVFW